MRVGAALRQVSVLGIAFGVLASAPVVARQEGPSVRSIALWEDARRFDDAVVEACLSHPAPEIRKRALLALSRLQDPRAVPALVGALEDPDPEGRALAAFALGQTGADGSGAVAALTSLLEAPGARVRGEAAVALGRIGGATEALVAAARRERDAEARASLAHALLHDGSDGAHEALLSLAKDPDRDVRFPAIYALTRQKVPSALPVLSEVAMSSSVDPLSRAFAIRGVGALGDSSAVKPLLAVVDAKMRSAEDSLSLRIEWLAALALHPDVLDADFLRGVPTQLLRSDAYGTVRLGAVRLLAAWCRSADDADADRTASARVELSRTALLDPSPWVRAAAFAGLARAASPSELDAFIDRALESDSFLLRESLVRALAELEAERAVPAIRRFYDEPDIRLQTTCVEALRSFPRASGTAELMTEAMQSDDLALRGAVTANLAAWKDPGWFRQLRLIYEASRRFDLTEVRAEAVSGLDALDDVASSGIFQRILEEDPEPMVRRRAAEALVRRGSLPISPDRIVVTPPSEEGLEPVEGSLPRVRVETTRGPFEIELDPAAPVHATGFLERVRAGFYDGLSFHRVVPNFVVQGGDPRGDGWGGLDRFVRDQWSPRRFERGTVGTPTAGKDTGGCQLFVTLVPTPHLDGRYTPFGRVTSGLSVVERLERGDRIVRAAVVSVAASEGR